jgi:hypothetical protein
MPTFLLDIVVHDAQLYESCNGVKGPVWITIRCDGLEQRFSTPQLPPSARVTWNCPVRLVLNLPSLEVGHFKTTLKTTGYLGEDLAIGCSQVRLGSLGIGQPKRFSFPLLNVKDFRIPAALATVTAGITVLPQQPQLRNTTPNLMYQGEPRVPVQDPRGTWNGYPPQAMVRHGPLSK